MLRQADYMRIHAQFTGLHGSMKTREEVADEIASIIIARRERKAKAEARKNNPAPRKSSRRKAVDDSRQLVFDFEIDDEPENVTTAPAPKQKRVRRTSRRKVADDSRQILIFLPEDISDCKTNKRMAA